MPIARFVEKPDLATANQFLAELERLAPEVVSSCRASLNQDTADLDFLRLEREAFANCPSVALDVAVMERTGLGNVLQKKVISEGARNCYLRSEHRLVDGLAWRIWW